jgi:cell division protein FtsN
MPKDYVHRSHIKTKRSKKRTIGIKFILSFIILLILCSGVFYSWKKKYFHHLQAVTNISDAGDAVVTEAKPIQLAPNDNSQNQPATIVTNNQIAAPKNVKFDFYQMLPKMRVNINNSAAATTNTPPKHSQYVLQLASFTDQSAASDFQTKIQQFGFNTKLYKTQQGNIVRYRVQIGPFKHEQDAEDMRDNLQRKNIDCILIRINHG